MQRQALFGQVPAAVPGVQTVGALLSESHRCRLAVAVHPLLAAACNQLTPLHWFPQHTSWADGWQLQLFPLFLYTLGPAQDPVVLLERRSIFKLCWCIKGNPRLMNTCMEMERKTMIML